MAPVLAEASKVPGFGRERMPASATSPSTSAPTAMAATTNHTRRRCGVGLGTA
jgi:hypothetical protein